MNGRIRAYLVVVQNLKRMKLDAEMDTVRTYFSHFLVLYIILRILQFHTCMLTFKSAPNEKMKDVLMKTLEEARALISKVSMFETSDNDHMLFDGLGPIGFPKKGV